MLYTAVAGSALIGLLTAAVELIGRYRAFPRAALLGVAGLTYLTVNAGAAAAAFALTAAFGWRFGLSDTASAGTVTLVRVIVAGSAAMALLRSSLFSFTQGETTVEAGPAGLLAGLRSVVDRSVDQRHAQALLHADLLTGLSFARDHEALTLLCSTALVNPDPQAAEALGDLAADLKARVDMDDAVKLRLYAMRLLELAGPRSVQVARDLLRLSAGPAPGVSFTGGVSPLNETVGPQALLASRFHRI